LTFLDDDFYLDPAANEVLGRDFSGLVAGEGSDGDDRRAELGGTGIHINEPVCHRELLAVRIGNEQPAFEHFVVVFRDLVRDLDKFSRIPARLALLARRGAAGLIFASIHHPHCTGSCLCGPLGENSTGRSAQIAYRG
jgi:hypothetical protein